MSLTIIIRFLGAYIPWHYVSYLSCAPALILVVTMFLMPESPVHLVSSGDQGDVKKAIASIR